jgi:Protein of unknown function (DUF2905)
MNGTGMGGGTETGFGWGLVVLGLIITGIGLIWVSGPHFLRLGRLSGDIVIEGKNSRVYFPVVTCLLISVALSVLWWIIRTVMR